MPIRLDNPTVRKRTLAANIIRLRAFLSKLTDNTRPIPDRRGNYPISIVKASSDSAECQVFDEQIDIITESLRPWTDIHWFPVNGLLTLKAAIHQSSLIYRHVAIA